jgi:hypothetical protein
MNKIIYLRSVDKLYSADGLSFLLGLPFYLWSYIFLMCYWIRLGDLIQDPLFLGVWAAFLIPVFELSLPWHPDPDSLCSLPWHFGFESVLKCSPLHGQGLLSWPGISCSQNLHHIFCCFLISYFLRITLKQSWMPGRLSESMKISEWLPWVCQCPGTLGIR